MTDDKPMSAEEVAADVIDRFDYGMSDGMRGRLIREFATALRDHAAEAVEAEREACAKVCSDFARDATYSNQADPCADWAASARVGSILADAIRHRARSEGGKTDG